MWDGDNPGRVPHCSGLHVRRQAVRPLLVLLLAPIAVSSFELLEDDKDVEVGSFQEVERANLVGESLETDELVGEALGGSELKDGEARFRALSRTEVQQTMNMAMSMLSEVRIKRVSEQIAIKSLVEKVNGKDDISPQSRAILQNISALLDDILEDMKAERDQNQVQLEHYRDNAEACEWWGLEEDWRLGDIMNESRSEHFECRLEEDSLFDESALYCTALYEYLGQLSTPVCEKPHAQISEVPTWDTFLAQGESWFDNTLAGFEPLRDDCELSIQRVRDQTVYCDQLQLKFESDFCMWRHQKLSRCDHHAQCRPAIRSQYLELWDDLMDLAGPRVREAALIMYMQCVLTNLFNGVVDQRARTTCEPVPFDIAEPIYNQSHVAWPEEYPCWPEEALICPGHPDWFYREYGDISVNTPAIPNALEGCYAGREEAAALATPMGEDIGLVDNERADEAGQTGPTISGMTIDEIVARRAELNPGGYVGHARTPERPPAPPHEAFVDDGCHLEQTWTNQQDDVEGHWRDTELTAGVRCCTAAGGCMTPGHCPGTSTWAEASAICEQNGHRLCNGTELLSHMCCGTGGNCDHYAVWSSTTNRSEPLVAPPPPPQQAYVDDGCQTNGGGTDVQGHWRSIVEGDVAGVRCCGPSGTCMTPGQCPGSSTYDEAVTICTQNGHRLCTREELTSDICCGMGGNCDHYVVWTSTTDTGT